MFQNAATDIIKNKIMTKALTQKRHVNLSDYEMTTTLGTGKFTKSFDFAIQSFRKESLALLVNIKW